jgi:hypothetical protein
MNARQCTPREHYMANEREQCTSIDHMVEIKAIVC